jgi:uncharacterized membrane protein YphA (DoxX/SURF4 family)
MSRIQLRSPVIVALRLVITVLFVPAILAKLQRPDAWAHLFATWGYPPSGALVISIIEIIGLAALWSPAIAKWATAALMITTAGATGTWLIHGPRTVAAYPGTIFVLVGVLAWLQQARARRDSHARHPEPLPN